MSMQDYERATQRIAANKHLVHSVGPRPESAIDKAEAALGLRFPPTYRRFLMEYGYFTIGRTEIYGIADENFKQSGIPFVAWHTLRCRSQVDIPRELVLIYSVGDGTEIALNTEESDECGENPVVALIPGLFTPDNSELQKVADDFGAFFLKEVEEVLRGESRL